MLNHLEYSELSILQIGQTRSETQASLCTLLFSWGFLPSVSVLDLFLSCSNFKFLCGDSCMGTIGASPAPHWALCLFWVCSPSPHSALHLFWVSCPSPHLALHLFWVSPPSPHLAPHLFWVCPIPLPWAPPLFWVCPLPPL